MDLNKDCTRYEYKEYCSVCNAELKHKIQPSQHDFNGRCGTLHEFANPQPLISDHVSPKVEKAYHIVCTKCHAYRNNARSFYCHTHVGGGNCNLWKKAKEMPGCDYGVNIGSQYWIDHPRPSRLKER